MYTSQETAKKMRAVVAYIKEEPRRLNMYVWACQISTHDELDPPCGTVGCFAGWTIMSTVGKEELGHLLGTDSVADAAADILGIDDHDAYILFYSTRWPTSFNEAYVNANSPAKRVQALSDRIEYFIETGN